MPHEILPPERKRSRRRLISRVLFFLALLVVLLGGWAVWLVTPHENRSQLTEPNGSEQAFARRLVDAGARHMKAYGRRDGGVAVEGTLAGRQFSLGIPPRWNGQAMLFAHGYSWPTNPTRVPVDSVANDPSAGLISAAYEQGFAVGQSAYDKSGVAVHSGALNTLALRRLLGRIGVRRVYLAGGSMGGNIVIALVDRYPGEFAGAIAACGVTDSWTREVEGTIDLRALYNFYTRGTEYALPGDVALDRSALPLSRPLGSDMLASLQQTLQLKRLARPIVALFAAARHDPRGREAEIIARISSMTPYHADSSSFFFPLASALFGTDDLRASFGGMPYGNAHKRYTSPLLSPDQEAELNRGVQRLSADPVAERYARAWHEATGRFTTPLITIHNRVDALVPFTQTLGLRRATAAAGNLEHLLQFEVPAVTTSIPVIGIAGVKHCGFTKQQSRRVFTLIRSWVESGTKPQGDGR